MTLWQRSFHSPNRPAACIALMASQLAGGRAKIRGPTCGQRLQMGSRRRVILGSNAAVRRRRPGLFAEVPSDGQSDPAFPKKSGGSSDQTGDVVRVFVAVHGNDRVQFWTGSRVGIWRTLAAGRRECNDDWKYHSWPCVAPHRCLGTAAQPREGKVPSPRRQSLGRAFPGGRRRSRERRRNSVFLSSLASCSTPVPIGSLILRVRTVEIGLYIAAAHINVRRVPRLAACEHLLHLKRFAGSTHPVLSWNIARH
jgi:hypothetical protein